MMGMNNKIELTVSYDTLTIGTIGYIIEVNNGFFKVYIPEISDYLYITLSDFKKV